MKIPQIKLYNTLSRKKETFRPIRKDWVGLYTCGPTVYNYAHIGNLRTYIFQDILKRTLEYAGYKVRHIMNLTDVDDKTIRDSKKAGKTLKKFTREYEKFFKEDLKKLNIRFPDLFTRATEYIPEMIKMTSLLLGRGLAYQKAGSVYFDISKFKNYGKLSRLKVQGLKTGIRIDTDEYTKDEARDFVLWKASRPGEPFWQSPFGRGRPGWHIECSAMSTKHLGPSFDIHTAAVDLIFPHHENEIAQSEGAYRKKFVRYWMHGEHLLVNGHKMSKSLGNIFTLRDVETRGISPLALRYLILGADYRSKLNFTWESLKAGELSLKRLYEFIKNLRSASAPQKKKTPMGRTLTKKLLDKTKKQFKEAIFNDLYTPKTLAIVWGLVKTYNKNPSTYNPGEVLGILYDFDQVLGLGLRTARPENIPQDILELARKRDGHRKRKQWKESDELREKINKLGFYIEDTAFGSKLRKKNQKIN